MKKGVVFETAPFLFIADYYLTEAFTFSNN